LLIEARTDKTLATVDVAPAAGRERTMQNMRKTMRMTLKNCEKNMWKHPACTQKRNQTKIKTCERFCACPLFICEKVLARNKTLFPTRLFLGNNNGE
jgi:hypothetical protein